ncbi:MAG: hypothetical protein HY693_05635 [Deltaproteobacteria bacterium]|nr:hypothetical protein [Deltaproteobacteria bacterium]
MGNEKLGWAIAFITNTFYLQTVQKSFKTLYHGLYSKEKRKSIPSNTFSILLIFIVLDSFWALEPREGINS